MRCSSLTATGVHRVQGEARNQTREYLASSDLTDDERKTLKMRTFGCYIMENLEGLVLRE